MSGRNASLSGSATKKEHYHAFLSHNGADKSLVEKIAEELEKRGLCCWLDNWNLVPGDPWQPAIEEALGQCDSCVSSLALTASVHGTTRKCAWPSGAASMYASVNSASRP
jgi:hypothetical protein